MDVTIPFKFIGSGAMCVSKPYKFIGPGAADVTKPYTFLGFGATDVTKPRKFIGFGHMDVSTRSKVHLGPDTFVLQLALPSLLQAAYSVRGGGHSLAYWGWCYRCLRS